MNKFKDSLERYCELHWWNMGRKTLSFKGNLKDLLKDQNITFTKRKTEIEGFFNYRFKSETGIVFKVRGSGYDFAHYANQFIQMELVRMGDPSQLYVQGTFRPTVTVNR